MSTELLSDIDPLLESVFAQFGAVEHSILESLPWQESSGPIRLGVSGKPQSIPGICSGTLYGVRTKRSGREPGSLCRSRTKIGFSPSDIRILPAKPPRSQRARP